MNQEEVANVLEKSAAFIEVLEAENATLRDQLSVIKTAETSKEVEKLAAAVQTATGEVVDLDVIRKIASSEDIAVKRLVEKLSSVEEVPSMGRGQSLHEKNAKEASLPPEDVRFLNFILGSNR